MNLLMLPGTWKADLGAGFLVFLIALPLCLGISMASGFPPTAGILTAVIGGLVVSFCGSARLTIKGPAAGLIVIALGAVTELGSGDNILGYKRALAVVLVAGLVQIGFALMKAGAVGDLMPPSVVQGMLAAIGVIIISKQAHVALGVSPQSREPLQLLAEIPRSILNLNPKVCFIGILSLLILFGLPKIKSKRIRRIPGPMLVLLAAVPLGLYFDLAHEHNYILSNHIFHAGPAFLIRLPGSLASSITYPDFSAIFTAASLKYIAMFSLVGSVESLLSVSAVDSLDPEKRPSDMNKDLLATGIGNTLAGALGGLPMISEIVRSKANIDNGAKSHWSNFFHGIFLLLSLALIPNLLQEIPLAALAGMLIYTGFRLASPREFTNVYRIGPEQLLLFIVTLLVTLATDLLIGVGAGMLLALALHLKKGARARSLFHARVVEERTGGQLLLRVHEAAIYTNFLDLKRRLQNLDSSVDTVIIDFENASVVDHAVLEKLHTLQRSWSDRRLIFTGLDNHESSSAHPLASRHRRIGVS